MHLADFAGSANLGCDDYGIYNSRYSCERLTTYHPGLLIGADPNCCSLPVLARVTIYGK